MKRVARSLLGAIGGVLWGAGSAVLIQQYGLWPLDPPLAYGAPLAGAVVSGLWSRSRRRRAAGVSAALVVAVLPLALVVLQPGTCAAFVETDGDGRFLGDTSPTDPFMIDPDIDNAIHVVVDGAGFEGVDGEAWVEFGGIRTFIDRSTVRGVLRGEFDLRDNGFADLGGAPGIYHVGGEIDNVCSADGYVEIAGNPLAGPVGQAGGAAVILGLLLTWFAGRPGGPAPDGGPRRAGRLRPDGSPIRLDGVEMRTPGLQGDARVHPPSDVAAGWTPAARGAFSSHHMELERVIEITNTAEARPGVDAELVNHLGEPALEIELPSPGPDHGQVVLATDESGVTSWHFPRLDGGAVDTTFGDPRRLYRIGRAIPPAEDRPSYRGLVTTIGSKLFSSLVFPLLDPVFERVGERFVRNWEEKRRPYRFRTFAPADYNEQEATEPDWDQLAQGKALLFVHGTFSRAHTGFGGLPRTTVELLHDMYQGRVFAFDHHTLSDDPAENVAWFFDNLPREIGLELDVVCHSRGGLVSRVLAEKQAEFDTAGRQVSVGKIVFVASPNAGTILTEPEYIGDLIDSYTNVLNFLPGHHVGDVLEGVITVVKQVAVGAVGSLAGLQAMRPSGEFLARLNTEASNQTSYHAIAGSYEPQVPGWRRYAVDRLMDGIFHEPNDLVIPTGGTWAANGSNHFPVTSRHEFRDEDGIDHTGYFANEHTGHKLEEWLRDQRQPA